MKFRCMHSHKRWPASLACTWWVLQVAALTGRVRRFSKLSNGVKIQQLTEGSGTPAQAGDKVLFDYVLRRSNGYFIYGYAPRHRLV